MTLCADVQQCSARSDVPGAHLVSRWAGTAHAAAAGGDAEVTIRIVDREEGAALNRRYRNGVDATNVLSFSYADDPHAPPGMLGDVVICAPVVSEEAASQGKSLDAHWAHMVVHGILHLCGFDHAREAAARDMEALETRVMAGLGFSAPYD